MRYTIPTNKDDQKTERGRILRAAASEKELQNIQQAVDWILGCTENTIPYVRDSSYRKLYEISKKLGITEGIKEARLFPEDSRSQEDFKKQLNDLWRILQVYAQEKTPNLLSAYQKYKQNPEDYDEALRDFDQKEQEKRARQGMPELEPEEEHMEDLPAHVPEQQLEEMPPLADANSPYAHLIKGSVYSELYDLYKNLQPQLHTGRNLAGRLLSEDMNQLLSKMQFHYLRRNHMGNMLPMTKDEHQEILELYHDCLRDCQRLSEKLKNKQEYKKLHTQLLKNANQLRYLPKDALPPLADAISSQSDPSIQLIAQEKQTIGKAISSREAVEYMDADGNIRRGFFTAERTLGDDIAELDEIINKYEKRYPEYSDYFKKIKKEKFDDEFQLMLDITMLYHVLGRKDKRTDPIKAYFRKHNWIDENNQPDEKFWDEIFIPVLSEMAKSTNMQGLLRRSGFESSDLLAERADAMSEMARFLGYPDLLVNSKRVTVERGDKKETGVMMDPADMELVDPSTIADDHPFYKLDEKEFHNRQFISSLADLQILDYLCANTDRHGKNFFLRMDLSDPEKPKLLGVQGIDNDNSFGDLNGGGLLKLADSRDLKIITPKMSEAVSSMTKEQLKEILKPYHFSSQQIQAAENRLEELQDMIKKGKESKKNPFKNRRETGTYDLENAKGTIYVMKEEDWGKIDMSSLLPKVVGDKNIFHFAYTHYNRLAEKKELKICHQELLQNLDKNPQKKEELLITWKLLHPEDPVDEDGKLIKSNKQEEMKPLSYTKQADKVDYQKLANMQNKELTDLEKMLGQFNAAHGNSTDVKRSGKFKAMRAALVDLMDEYRRMSDLNPDIERINGQEELKKNRDKNLMDCYARIEKKRQNLKQAIDTYLDIWHWKKHPSENNQKRINTAKQLSALVMDAPSSEQFYKSSKSLQDTKRSKETTQDPFAAGRYVTNEIHSMMKLTLRDNVNALKLDDPLREKGLQAMKVHERLWNYSQNSVFDGFDKETKEKTSLTKLLEEKKWEKRNEKTDINQIRTDLETIKEYAAGYDEELGKYIAQILEEDEITPRRVGGVLSNLLVSGSKLTKERKEAAKKQKVERANDISTTVKKQ